MSSEKEYADAPYVYGDTTPVLQDDQEDDATPGADLTADVTRDADASEDENSVYFEIPPKPFFNPFDESDWDKMVRGLAFDF